MLGPVSHPYFEIVNITLLSSSSSSRRCRSVACSSGITTPQADADRLAQIDVNPLDGKLVIKLSGDGLVAKQSSASDNHQSSPELFASSFMVSGVMFLAECLSLLERGYSVTETEVGIFASFVYISGTEGDVGRFAFASSPTNLTHDRVLAIG